MKFKLLFATLMCTMLLFAVGCGADNSKTDTVATNVSSEKNKIYFVGKKDSSQTFWKDMDEACKKAADSIGNIEYKFVAPENFDVSKQAELIDQAVADGAKVILVSALSNDQLNASLEKADKAGVKIIYVDSPASYNAVATFVTDNNNAGKVAGETMLKLIQDAGIQSGTIGVVSESSIGVNINDRINGFTKFFEGTPFTVAEPIYFNNDFAALKAEIGNHSDYVAFLATDSTASVPLGEQVKDSGTNQIVVTFDVNDSIIDLIKNDTVKATIEQDIETMAQESMKAAVQAIEGNFTDKNAVTYTDVKVVTKSDIEK